MESENDKQSRYDEYECREYEEWTEREEDKLGPVLRAAPLVPWSKEKYLQSIKKIKDLGGDARTSQH